MMLSRFRRSRIGSKGKLALWPLVMTIFFCVSGGPYGLETVVQSGRGVALLLILLVPLVWAAPIAMMSAELGSAIPEEGGYYQWVRQGIGPRAGFWCAWLTYLYSCVDVAIYPRLFVGYLGALGYDSLLHDPIVSLIVRIAMVAPLAWLNIRGVVSAGNASFAFAVVLLVPFVAIVALGFIPAAAHFGTVVSPLAPTNTMTAITTGLFVIMWNYLGWDSISTISREIDNAPKVFPRALMIGLPLVVLIYLLPTFVGLLYVPDITKWTDGSWPMIASAIGGNWLGIAVGLGGLLSAAGLFVAGLLAASRIPFVLAADGYMPQAFTKLHSKYATPSRAIISSAIIYVIISSFSFEQLAEVDVLLYSSALLLEFWALVRLRKMRPEMKRPFKIPGGIRNVALVAILPTLIIIAATAQMLATSWRETVLLFAFAGLSGWMLMWFRKKQVIHPESTS
jgi:amino acid transporter